MAQTTQISTFEKLLNTRYPLTNYLYRQQQFLKVHSNTSNPLNTTPSLSSNSTEVLSTIAVQTRKTPLPAPTCFNVPDTLDFNASGYEQDEEMDQNSEINDDIAALGFDETLLKSIDNHINNKTKAITYGKYPSILQRSSAIQLDFSPCEPNSPLQKAIEKGLTTINR